ncbi:interleukin-6 receptor subunit beta isoform X1 [Ascaphus truei]|uniref:interleukin-6 receptor subunit beta isoform X1 n=1 Tax=Ascaphus truei TaxID=8439 RepID=UPI003F5AD9BC
MITNIWWVTYPLLISTVSGQLIKFCAHIIPESPVLELNSKFTAFCVLNESCADKGVEDASQVFWKIKTAKVPAIQYKVINRTVSSVTFENTSMLDSPLTCNILLYGQMEQTLHGIFFKLGLPPDKPENLTCMVYKEKLTCTWNPGRPTFLSTNYTLKHEWKAFKPKAENGSSLEQNEVMMFLPATRAEGRSWSNPKFEHVKAQRNQIIRPAYSQPDCIPEGVNDSCTIAPPNFQFFVTTKFWVEAENALGTMVSDPLTEDPINIIKPNPPIIESLNSTVELPKALKIVWVNPMPVKGYPMTLKYTIRYRTNSSMEWMEVPSEDTATHRTSFTVQGLLPYTEYVVSLRCMKDDGKGYWSDWSAERTAVTPEDKPIKGPELWRQIYDADSGRNRSALFMWKDLEPLYARGVVLGYTLTVKQRWPRTLTSRTYKVIGTSHEVPLTKDAYVATIIAHNSVGDSPLTNLFIPATNTKVLPPEIYVKAFPKDSKLWVEWTASNKSVYGFVIEWCIKSDSTSCNVKWQREPNTSNGAFLRGDIKPFKCYLIKVHPLYNDGHESARTVEAYLQQGSPSMGPVVRTKTVDRNRAVLMWSPVSLDSQNGFIINYTLTYKPSNGNESSVSIDPLSTEYTLASLTGDTLYMVHMVAYTEKGGTEGPKFTFTTQKFAPGEVELIVVSSCIAFLVLMLLGFLLCFSKKDLIKKHIWPNVPDPSKSNLAQWFPQTPNRHEFNSKEHPFQDGGFTDVSVVEITAEEKKSYPEQDIKPMDPLKKEKNTSEGLSSGIGGSSCMSSPRLSVSDSDEVESVQTTSSTVQYSTVILSGYRDQQPTAVVPHLFSRSESTQPLLDSEERPDDQQVLEREDLPVETNQYFKQNCSQEDCTGKLQTLHQEDLAQLSSQDQHPCGVSLEKDLQDFPVGQNPCSGEQAVDSQVDTANVEIKSYLPQAVRRGGYMPQ